MAGIMALLILLTGTFAWQSISQLAINNAEGIVFQAGARLHDDFADSQDWLNGANEDI
jgi:hypothetical protein